MAKPEKRKDQDAPEQTAAMPGEITHAAQEAIAGDPEAQAVLYSRIIGRLQEKARWIQAEKGAPELSPSEVSWVAIDWLLQEKQIDITSRQVVFEFTDNATAEIIDEIISYGDQLPLDSRVARSLRARFSANLGEYQPLPLGHTIRRISDLDPFSNQLLRFHYVLDLPIEELVALTERSVEEIQESLREAESFLAGFYPLDAANLEPVQNQLDSSKHRVYSAIDQSHQAVLAKDIDAPPAPAPEESGAPLSQLRSVLTAAQAKFTDLPAQASEVEAQALSELQSLLDEALDAVAILESEEATVVPFPEGANSTREEITALLTPPDLSQVPLLQGSSLEELWDQFVDYYGPWLKHFNRERDYVFLDQIRAHDRAGIKKLSEKISRRRGQEKKQSGIAKTLRLGDIVPKREERGDQVLHGRKFEELLEKDNRDLAVLACARLMKHLYRR